MVLKRTALKGFSKVSCAALLPHCLCSPDSYSWRCCNDQLLMGKVPRSSDMWYFCSSRVLPGAHRLRSCLDAKLHSDFLAAL